MSKRKGRAPYTFTMAIDVWDKRALHRAARASYVEENGGTPENAAEFLLTDDGSVDVE